MTEGKPAEGDVVGACPRCGDPLHAVGLLGAQLLAQVRRYPWESLQAGTAGRRPPPERRLR
jgi:hypothetical protein